MGNPRMYGKMLHLLKCSCYYRSNNYPSGQENDMTNSEGQCKQTRCLNYFLLKYEQVIFLLLKSTKQLSQTLTNLFEEGSWVLCEVHCWQNIILCVWVSVNNIINECLNNVTVMKMHNYQVMNTQSQLFKTGQLGKSIVVLDNNSSL